MERVVATTSPGKGARLCTHGQDKLYQASHKFSSQERKVRCNMRSLQRSLAGCKLCGKLVIVGLKHNMITGGSCRGTLRGDEISFEQLAQASQSFSTHAAYSGDGLHPRHYDLAAKQAVQVLLSF